MKLNAIAAACGIELEPDSYLVKDQVKTWRPHLDDGDCAAMCASLRINTEWGRNLVQVTGRGEVVTAMFSDFDNSKMAAWRHACVALAEEIIDGIPA